MALFPTATQQGLGLRDGVLRPVCVRSSLLGGSRATLSTFPEVLRSAVPYVSAAAAWAALRPLRPLRQRRGATESSLRLRARSFRVDEVKTTELEEALRFLGFDSFPKMKNRQSLVKWIREWRIPHQMLEGALSEVRKLRKADLRSKGASAKAKAERGRDTSRSGSKPRSSSRKTKRGGNLYEFTDGQLRTALNVCGVQGTAEWHKRDLVRKLQSMGIRVKDVQALVDEMNPSGKRIRRQNSRSRGKRRPPMSRAERDFFADTRVVNEFLREEYDDWDDEDEDDYFDFTMDDEPWDSVPWDSEFDDYFADAHEETQYRRGSQGPAENYSYSAPGPDPWNNPGGWTYTSASGYNGSYYQSARSQSTGSTWPKAPTVTPEEAMSRALREGWKAEGMSRTQACMLLGLSGQPMPTEVQKVRRQMALRWHPDKNPDNAEAHMAFQLVMAAAEKLNA